MNPITIIPARMKSNRLPGKPLADIHGVPMIIHVMRRGLEADLGPVIVAAGDKEIAEAVRDHGGIAIETNPELPSGSDRSAEALRIFDPAGAYDGVVSLQGDMPTANPADLRIATDWLARSRNDIVTLGCPIRSAQELRREAVVKIAMEHNPATPGRGRAVYFSRAIIPHKADRFFHHIGLYVYRRDALERFVAAPPSTLERIERLEQLRALALGMSIGVAIVDSSPLGVDTLEDLEEARRRLAPEPIPTNHRT